MSVPIMYVTFGLAPEIPLAPPMVSGAIFALLSAAALFVDRRRFRQAKTAVG